MLLLFFYYVYLFVWSAEMEIHICHNVSVERVSYLFSTHQWSPGIKLRPSTLAANAFNH